MVTKKKKIDVSEQTVVTSISKIAKMKPKRAYLFFLSGPLLGKLFPLQDGVTILGRNPDADIVVGDSRVSRHHVEIYVDGEEVKIRDLGSTNGTFVSGEKIPGQQILEHDDKVQISPATIFKFSLADEDEKIAFDELYELGVIDPLTNIYNKRYFTDRLKEELSISMRSGIDLSLMMIDIDFFKNVNDTYGHLTGDFVLRSLSKILKTMTRNEDIVARYGGEEFVVVLRNTPEEGAKLLAERIRNTVEKMPVTTEGKTLKFTISIGISSLDDDRKFESIEDFIGAADKCLYYSKEHGRNRVTCMSDAK